MEICALQGTDASVRFILTSVGARVVVPSELGTGTYTVGMTIEQLEEEVRQHRRRAEISSAMAARMADELSEAHAEIARLRVKNDFLERGISADLGQKYR